MAEIQKPDKVTKLSRLQSIRSSYSSLVGMQNVISTLEDSSAVFFTKLNIVLSYDSIIILLDVYITHLEIMSAQNAACECV